ncbi:patatin-like phospholipase family protein [Nannocystis punicea]|uniref:Patatin-like phospholipase family protein n=1 Tax=Nannocystis punicea TaxID=2995304 RepID=A0ABY7HEI1_9BACT|nr:patatin-like phospholipase family protein [Nannocystis poenicansa]WAS97480.1 patatin-like phospholipase family protein [Nannocystis poenicansa]
MPKPPHTALVLSAGGVRGAYQVGVLDGLVEVLGLRGAKGPPIFSIFAGTSVGALNAAYLAANAHHADHRVAGLVDVWQRLELRDTLRFTPLSLWGWPFWHLPGRYAKYDSRMSPYVGRSLFDPRPTERLLGRVIAWDRLHANIDASVVRALTIAALDVCDGRTTLFAELAPGVTLRPCHTHRRTLLKPIDAQRVLASSALPLVYPARNIEGRYYMDGAVRFGTPIGPALRAGADRVMVISLLERSPAPVPMDAPDYPGFLFMLGKLCSALLLDPVSHDIDNLLRINEMFEAIDEALGAAEFKAVTERLDAAGDLPYRRVPTLVFRPSEDIAALTADFIRRDLVRSGIGPIRQLLIRGVSRSHIARTTELASILLLDGSLATRLIALGRHDAFAAKDRILEFFG